MVGPDGPICPGCDRMCRIPATANLVRDDAITVCGVSTKRKRANDFFDVLDIEIR